MDRRCFWTIALGALLLPQLSQALIPLPGEMAEARRWAAAKFEGIRDIKLAEPATGSLLIGIKDRPGAVVMIHRKKP